MAEFFLELFSEEIPARMQAGAAENLARLLGEALSPLSPRIKTFYGPRRIAAVAEILPDVPAAIRTERGPRTAAPEAALAGFLRKHAAPREHLVTEGDYWVLRIETPARPAAALIAEAMPGLLRRFPWPKSMRWGGTSAFTWVRPLRRILCLLDGAVVPFDLRDGTDDGHGLASGNLTEGHRFLSPGPVTVSGAAEWRTALAARHVIVDAAARRAAIAEGLARAAGARGLTVVADETLLDEVTGLVEWPLPLLGRIDAAFMDLPPEVMQVSMRINQRYFALRDAEGQAAPWFAFVANIETADQGAAIIAGNERVLRARFADARHFWDLDRSRPLARHLDALSRVSFHNQLGTQAERALRIRNLAEQLAIPVGADRGLAFEAAMLAKADLTTGMVGEFPELQGTMGSYYVREPGRDKRISWAIADQYLPRGVSDRIPRDPVGITVALADKLDTLAGFFSIGETPTGSSDPYGLRRAALGIIRIIREWQPSRPLRLELRRFVYLAAEAFSPPADTHAILAFIHERLRIQLRSAGTPSDIFDAAFHAAASDDLVRLINRIAALDEFLSTDDGANLLSAYRRANGILRAEERSGHMFEGGVSADLLRTSTEQELFHTLIASNVGSQLLQENDRGAMRSLSTLRPTVDRFFAENRVIDEDPAISVNRLRLLYLLRTVMNQVADFSKIEG